MKTIYKYKVDIVSNVQILHLPAGAEILTAQIQGGQIQLWAIVNPERKRTEKRHIEVFATGQPFEISTRRHIATVQFDIPNLVYHVFENFGK